MVQMDNYFKAELQRKVRSCIQHSRLTSCDVLYMQELEVTAHQQKVMTQGANKLNMLIADS
jgi:hypothetical protein